MLASTNTRTRRIHARLRCRAAVLARLDARLFRAPALIPTALASIPAR